jgi:hypothetical protein
MAGYPHTWTSFQRGVMMLDEVPETGGALDAERRLEH